MRYSAVLAFLAVVGVGRASAAQDVDHFGAYGENVRRQRRESPQEAAVELRFGRYVPKVDSEFSGPTPFADTFGDNNRYMLGFEADWQILRIPHLGSLGPGFGWEFTRISAKAPFTNSPGRSEEDTTLSIMPFYVVGVLRADVFARDYGVPLVPYAKLGLGGALWWSNDGGDSARAGDMLGRGTSYGYQFALGGMFLLDPLDPETALSADASIGINHSYVFAEWYQSSLDGFGSGKVMQVGVDTWVLGIAVEL